MRRIWVSFRAEEGQTWRCNAVAVATAIAASIVVRGVGPTSWCTGDGGGRPTKASPPCCRCCWFNAALLMSDGAKANTGWTQCEYSKIGGTGESQQRQSHTWCHRVAVQSHSICFSVTCFSRDCLPPDPLKLTKQDIRQR